MKNVFVVGDSFGVERIHDGELQVSLSQTYPELIKDHFQHRKDVNVVTSNVKYRKLTELPSIANEVNYDVCIVQLGIVDIYPRPLNQQITMSKSKYAVLLKRISRKFRAFILRYIYNKPWSSENEIMDVLNFCKASEKEYFFVGCGPLSVQQAKASPGALLAIKQFNQLLKDFADNTNNIKYIDVFTPISGSSNPLIYINIGDSHLTKEGNILYFNLIKEAITNECSA